MTLIAVGEVLSVQGQAITANWQRKHQDWLSSKLKATCFTDFQSDKPKPSVKRELTLECASSREVLLYLA